MVFQPPEWIPTLPIKIPYSIPVSEFMLDERWGRYPQEHARPPFTCGLTGTEYTALEVRDRVNTLAPGLSKELGWKLNLGSEWDQIVGVFSGILHSSHT